MAEQNWERRVLTSWGSNVRFDVNNPQVSTGGRDIYSLYGFSQDEENVSLVRFQEDGKFSVYCDNTLELVGGQKTNTDGVDVSIIGLSGDVFINAEKNGTVKIRAKNIEIQADEDVDITGGRNVNINAGSGRVLISGNTLEKTGLKGNLLEPNQNWAWRVFEGTGLPAYAFPQLASPFSGITDLAGSLINTPDLFSGFVSGAVSNAIAGAGQFA